MRPQSRSVRIARGFSIAALVCSAVLLILFVVWSESLVSRLFNNGLPITPTFGAIVQTIRYVVLAAALVALGAGLLGWRAQKQVGKFIHRRRDLLAGLALLAATVLVLLVAGEVLARMMLADTTFDSGGAAHKEQLAEVTYNSMGFRDREFSTEKPEGTLRIVALGDSFTFGHGLENDSAPWPKVLERRLNEESAQAGSGVRYEVINTGKNGFQPRDELAALNQTLPMQPDVVLLGYFFNDAETDTAIRSRGEAGSVLKQLGTGTHLFLFSHSYLYGFVKVRWTMTKINLGLEKGYPQKMNDVYRLHGDDLGQHKQELLAIRRAAEESGATFAIVVIPANYDFSDYPLKDGHEFVARFCEESGTSCVDLLPLFSAQDYRLTRLNEYDSHPNEYGHSLIAEGVLNSTILKR